MKRKEIAILSENSAYGLFFLSFVKFFLWRWNFVIENSEAY